MLAVPQIEDALKGDRDKSFGDDKWLWYIALAVPITVVTLLAYFAWEILYKRRYLKSLFDSGPRKRGAGREQGFELRELDLEAGGGGALAVGNGGLLAIGNGIGGQNGLVVGGNARAVTAP